ncbi:hypothetical protein MNBD_GAMMA17-421 [hydrothermal vent metagenome]|uniref:N-acetyltransferase domain-containing protein n=1 Tax=hydrothermal vent metagenome TaxID=652676 RepID=A0A3B0ZG47_9ZZZZ
MEIIGDKIQIRTFRPEDTIPFHTAATESIEHMHEFMPWCHPGYSIEESASWVTSRAEAWNSAEEYSFVIYSADNTELLGGVAINQINASHKIGNIGYWVRKRALNRGVATEAILLIANFGFKSLGLLRQEIVMMPNNQASRRVAEKAGAKYEGVMQKRLLVHEQACDACMYSLIDGKEK